MANKLYKPILIESIKVTNDIQKQRFIDFEGNICTDGKKAFGVSDADISANEYAPIGVLGTFLIEAGGTITAGDAITSDANGKAITVSETKATNGYALDNASEGEVFRIIRGI